ncbi:hypothetical protein DENSPDRAFT_129152 [Dentipellis sp. KUC8613]|nr:hypothetical protein DENSPDRAFT_129152 [Dentipellis sp. KUC8613]
MVMDTSPSAVPYSPDLTYASPILLHYAADSYLASSRPSPAFSPVNSRQYRDNSFGRRDGSPAWNNEASASGFYNDTMFWEPQTADYLGEAKVFSRAHSPGERSHSDIMPEGDVTSFSTGRDPPMANQDQVLDASRSPSYTSRFPSIDHILKQKVVDNMFSTPGPTYRAYFDSPTEDPSSSPPSSPHIYPLDEKLDFHWTPFLQGDRSESTHGRPEHPVSLNLHRSKYDPEYPVDHREAEELTDTANFSPALQEQEQARIYEPAYAPGSAAGSLTGTSADVALDGWEICTQARKSMADGTPADGSMQPATNEQAGQEPEEPVFAFAPAPGIFVSPLRDNQTESTSDTQPDPHPNSSGQDSTEKKYTEVPPEDPIARVPTSTEQVCL